MTGWDQWFTFEINVSELDQYEYVVRLDAVDFQHNIWSIKYMYGFFR